MDERLVLLIHVCEKREMYCCSCMPPTFHIVHLPLGTFLHGSFLWKYFDPLSTLMNCGFSAIVLCVSF